MLAIRHKRIHEEGPLFGGLKVIIKGAKYEVVSSSTGHIVANIWNLGRGVRVGFRQLLIRQCSSNFKFAKMWQDQKQFIEAFVETHRRLTAPSEAQCKEQYQKDFVKAFFFSKPLSKTRPKKFAVNVPTYQKTF